MKKIILVFLVVIIASGCAATGPKYKELSDLSDENKSEIVVYRKKQFSASGGCYRVEIDGEKIGVLANGGFLRRFVDPGVHEVNVAIGDDLSLAVQTAKGSKNFVLLSIGLSGLSAFPVGTLSVVNSSWNVALIDTPKSTSQDIVNELRDSSSTQTCMSNP